MNPLLVSEEILSVVRSNQGRVTPADASARSGLPVSEVISQLNRLALNTQATLEVKDKGGILYCFPKLAWYLPSLLSRRLSRCLMLCLSVCNSIVVTAFEIMLLLLPFLVVWALGEVGSDTHSVFLRGLPVFLALFVVLLIAIVGGLKAPRYIDPRYLLEDCTPDSIWVKPSIPWPSQTQSHFGFYAALKEYMAQRVLQEDNRAFNIFNQFLHDCHSFVVGPARQGPTYEAEMWREIAEYIREHRGVVTSEELVQFTGAELGSESGVIPVLVRFNGIPEVTASGYIVYAFPALLLTAEHSAKKEILCPEEPRWIFTDCSLGRTILVLAYGFLNFGAAAAVMGLLSQNHVQLLPHPLVSQAQPLALLLRACLSFSSFFVFYPLCRAVLITLLNIPIDRRNSRRQEAQIAVAEPSIELEHKFAELIEFEHELTDVAHCETVYKTDEDLLEQQF